MGFLKAWYIYTADMTLASNLVAEKVTGSWVVIETPRPHPPNPVFWHVASTSCIAVIFNQQVEELQQRVNHKRHR